MIIITIANQKGGTGKSTTAAHIAAGLAETQHTVLAIDLDTQSTLGTMLGVDRAPGASALLLDHSPAQHIANARPHLNILPSDKSLRPCMDSLLRRYDGHLPADYLVMRLQGSPQNKPDYIVLDTGPAASQLQALAIVAADLLVIPACCDLISPASVADMADTIQHVADDTPVLIQPTFSTPTVVSDQALHYYRRTYPTNTLDAIARATALADAAGQQKTIYETQPNSRAAHQYRRLVQTILDLDLA